MSQFGAGKYVKWEGQCDWEGLEASILGKCLLASLGKDNGVKVSEDGWRRLSNHRQAHVGEDVP